MMIVVLGDEIQMVDEAHGLLQARMQLQAQKLAQLKSSYAIE